MKILIVLALTFALLAQPCFAEPDWKKGVPESEVVINGTKIYTIKEWRQTVNTAFDGTAVLMKGLIKRVKALEKEQKINDDYLDYMVKQHNKLNDLNKRVEVLAKRNRVLMYQLDNDYTGHLSRLHN
jgi:hypothetical protein